MGFVTIIHPETGNTADVHPDGLAHYYASGWRLLADDEKPQDGPAPDPEPVTKAQAAKAAKSSKTAAAESEGQQ
jgi:hypothetical protein